MIGRAVRVSAKTGEGLDRLLAAIEEDLPAPSVRVHLLLPFSESGLESKIRKNGSVESREYTQDGLLLTASIPSGLSETLRKFILE